MSFIRVLHCRLVSKRVSIGIVKNFPTNKNDNYTVPQALLMTSCAIWITGLPASGKTTIAKLLKDHLKSKNMFAIILDGDEIRKTISKLICEIL
ncbi:MAG: adenylyl-sulfate kinase [Nitrosotalea sp.]